jgi:SAM-dependent methyltransferase
VRSHLRRKRADVDEGLVQSSRYWDQLWSEYPAAPSISFCRVPEVEYASRLRLDGMSLDHCCGDGRFAQLTWPDQKFSAGCDWSATSIDAARQKGRHQRLDVCDAGKRLPYDDSTFDLVFDNSALEHIVDLEPAMREIARVTKPGGRFVLNVLNRRYFDWWPLDEASKREYREAQPFHHALTLDEWRAVFARSGFELVDVQGYFDRGASRALAYLDCTFSLFFLRNKPSVSVALYQRLGRLLRPVLKSALGRLRWKTSPDEGAGYFLVGVRAASAVSAE